MRARVVIYNHQSQAVLLIHRLKNGRDYWVVPGGGAEGQETPIQTAIREIREELQIVLTPDELHQLFVLQEQEREVFFYAESTQVATPDISGEEAERASATNVYLPTWVKVNNLPQIDLMPPEVSGKIVEFFNKN
ncbi:NUDIX domain-containing protein [Lactobacillus sp. ESL0731]|uniref:NUDIX domain-containing protein n=1 Tax=unclassified Lactobacillus TaxID=2620435 RepID=UPI0023F8E162|nr:MULTISPECIES: NUDIX domain-containing protein [unclassified Lactobacillus]WEV50856.1 NUDIX domain-containing protein [Lactobacillus sp. ESL0700]WEV61987.1 NUDIX domain-containing protein [Lactobacillus sp. ESL0731]